MKINTRLKLMGLWISLLFLYVYCDIFSFFRTGILSEIADGLIGPFEISQGMLAVLGLLMIIPALMILACLFLKEGPVRILNIIAGIAYTIINIGNLIGETWVYYWIFGIAETVVTLFIVINAIKWTKGCLHN